MEDTVDHHDIQGATLVLYMLYKFGMLIVTPAIIVASFVMWITSPTRMHHMVAVRHQDGFTRFEDRPRGLLFRRNPAPLLIMAIMAIIFACYVLGEIYGPV